MRNIFKAILCASFMLAHTQLTLNAMEAEDFDESKTEQPQVNSDAQLQDLLRCMDPEISHADQITMYAILKENPHIINQYPAYSRIFLACSILANDLEMTAHCVTNGADVNSALCFNYPYYTTPLETAVYFSKNEIIKFLLDCGANVFAERNNGETILYHSSYGYADDCVTMLVRYGANLLDNNQRQVLLDRASTPKKQAAIQKGLRQAERYVCEWLNSDYNLDTGNVIRRLPPFFSSMIGRYI